MEIEADFINKGGRFKLNKLIEKLKFIGDKIDVVCKAFIGVQLVVLTVIVIIQVVLRLNSKSIGWATEFVTLTFIWASLLGSAIASRHMLHIGVDTIRDRLTGMARKIFMLVSHMILLIGLVIFTLSSFDYTLTQAAHAATTMPTVSLGWFYCSLPICGAIMLYYTFIQFLEIICYGDAVKIELSADEEISA